jgi:hypothetical protein
MSSKNKIILILVSIVLVIGGIAILNSVFNNRAKNGNTTTNTSSSKSAVYDSGYRSPDFYLGKDDANNQTGDAPQNAGNSKSGSNSSISNSNSSSKSSSSSSSLSSSKLAKGEALVKFNGGSDKNFDILDCNLEQIFYCKAGVKLTLGTNEKLEVGKNYKLSGGTITDTKEGLNIDSIQIVLAE